MPPFTALQYCSAPSRPFPLGCCLTSSMQPREGLGRDPFHLPSWCPFFCVGDTEQALYGWGHTHERLSSGRLFHHPFPSTTLPVGSTRWPPAALQRQPSSVLPGEQFRSRKRFRHQHFPKQLSQRKQQSCVPWEGMLLEHPPLLPRIHVHCGQRAACSQTCQRALASDARLPTRANGFSQVKVLQAARASAIFSWDKVTVLLETVRSTIKPIDQSLELALRRDA